MNGMRKKIFNTLILILIVTTSIAANGQNDGDEKVFKVGYINADLENPAWNAVAMGFSDRAEELGMKGKAVSSSGQASTQMKNAQDMVAAMYDAVAISAPDSPSANDAVKKLNKAGIPFGKLHMAPDKPDVEFVEMVKEKKEGGNNEAGKYLAEKYKK